MSDHTPTSYTIKIVGQEENKNRRLRLEESWIHLLDTIGPKGLNLKLQMQVQAQKTPLEIYTASVTQPADGKISQIHSHQQHKRSYHLLPSENPTCHRNKIM